MALKQAGFGLVLGLSLAFGSNRALAQADPESVTIQTIPVAEGIYMLTGDGGNIGLCVGQDGTFMIDDQFAPLSDKIKAAIAELTDQPVRFVVNTHGHFDHVGGNENFAKDGAVIVAHDNVRERMKVDQFIEALQKKIPAYPAKALPLVTFNDQTTLHLNDQTIQVNHVNPAHTDGDSIVYFQQANVLHAGDTYFNGLYPFIDTSSGGSLAGMISAVDQLLAIANDNTQIIPGHGPLSKRSELEAYQALLSEVQNKVNAAIANNMTLEEFIASKPTAQYDETWGKGFLTPSQFLTIVYSDALTKAGKPAPNSQMPIQDHHESHSNQDQQSESVSNPVSGEHSIPVVKGL